MTHYDISYNPSREPSIRAAEDLRALNDMRNYIGDEIWTKMGELYFQPQATMEETSISDKKKIVQSVRMNCHMLLGVQGRPVEAYLRMMWRVHSMPKAN